MQWLLLVGAYVAFLWWMRNKRRRREVRARNAREIAHTLLHGMPAPDTALGQHARRIAEAQADKLHNPPPVHGSARWADAYDAGALLARERVHGRGLILGELIEGDRDTRRPLIAQYPGHILTVAATGQGKSVTQIIANLRRYSGAAVVIDPKGELWDLTANARRRFGPVYRIAPFAREGLPDCHRYNPLAELTDPRERPARARLIAEMLIVRQGDKGAAEAAFFENEAVNLLTLLILGTVEMAELAGEPDQNTLSEVRRICALPILAGLPERKDVEYFEDVMELYAQAGASALVRRQARAFASLERKLLSSFLSELNSNLAFFDGHPGFGEVTAASDFFFADFARGAVATVYLTIPLKETHTSFRFLRAMIGCAFAALEEQRDAREASVLFILDEFAALRDMAFMRDAVAQMRSSGAWFWFFVQDVAQLRAVYHRWASVFLSQTDHQLFFGASLDPATLNHISQALGVTTFPYRDASVSWNHSIGTSDSDNATPFQLGGFGESRNVGQSVTLSEPVMLAPRALLTPFEVGTYLAERRPGDSHPTTAILLSKQVGGFPVKLRRRHWQANASTIEVLPPSRNAGAR